MGVFDLLELSLSYGQYLVLLYGFQPRSPFPEWNRSPLFIIRAINLDAAKWVDNFRDPDAAERSLRSFIPLTIPIDIRLSYLFIGTMVPFIISCLFVLLMGPTALSVWFLLLLMSFVFILGGLLQNDLPIEFVDPDVEIKVTYVVTALGCVMLTGLLLYAGFWLMKYGLRRVKVQNNSNKNESSFSPCASNRHSYKLVLQPPIPRTLTVRHIRFNDTMEMSGWATAIRVILAGMALMAALDAYKIVSLSVFPFFSALGGFSTTMGTVFIVFAVILLVYTALDFFEEIRQTLWDVNRVVNGWLLWIAALLTNAIIVPIGSAAFPAIDCVDSSNDCPSPYFRLPDPTFLSYTRFSHFQPQTAGLYNLTNSFQHAVTYHLNQTSFQDASETLPLYCQPIDTFRFDPAQSLTNSSDSNCPASSFEPRYSRVYSDRSVACGPDYTTFFDSSVALVAIFHFIGFIYLNYHLTKAASHAVENEFPLDATQSIGLTEEQLVEEKLLASNNIAKLIYGPYKREYKHWRILLILHKLLVVFSGTFGFASGGVVTSFSLTFFFHIAMGIIQIVCRPFRRRVENYLAFSTQVMLTLVSLVGLIAVARIDFFGSQQLVKGNDDDVLFGGDGFYIFLLISVIVVPLASLIVGYVLTHFDDKEFTEQRTLRISDAIEKAASGGSGGGEDDDDDDTKKDSEDTEKENENENEDESKKKNKMTKTSSSSSSTTKTKQLNPNKFAITGLSKEEEKKIRHEELYPEKMGELEGVSLSDRLMKTFSSVMKTVSAATKMKGLFKKTALKAAAMQKTKNNNSNDHDDKNATNILPTTNNNGGETSEENDDQEQEQQDLLEITAASVVDSALKELTSPDHKQELVFEMDIDSETDEEDEDEDDDRSSDSSSSSSRDDVFVDDEDEYDESAGSYTMMDILGGGGGSGNKNTNKSKDSSSSPPLPQVFGKNKITSEAQVLSLKRQGTITTHQKARLINQLRQKQFEQKSSGKNKKKHNSNNTKNTKNIEAGKEDIDDDEDENSEDDFSLAAIYHGAGGISITAKSFRTNNNKKNSMQKKNTNVKVSNSFDVTPNASFISPPQEEKQRQQEADEGSFWIRPSSTKKNIQQQQQQQQAHPFTFRFVPTTSPFAASISSSSPASSFSKQNKQTNNNTTGFRNGGGFMISSFGSMMNMSVVNRSSANSSSTTPKHQHHSSSNNNTINENNSNFWSIGQSFFLGGTSSTTDEQQQQQQQHPKVGKSNTTTTTATINENNNNNKPSARPLIISASTSAATSPNTSISSPQQQKQQNESHHNNNMFESSFNILGAGGVPKASYHRRIQLPPIDTTTSSSSTTINNKNALSGSEDTNLLQNMFLPSTPNLPPPPPARGRQNDRQNTNHHNNNNNEERRVSGGGGGAEASRSSNNRQQQPVVNFALTEAEVFQSSSITNNSTSCTSAVGKGGGSTTTTTASQGNASSTSAASASTTYNHEQAAAAAAWMLSLTELGFENKILQSFTNRSAMMRNSATTTSSAGASSSSTFGNSSTHHHHQNHQNHHHHIISAAASPHSSHSVTPTVHDLALTEDEHKNNNPTNNNDDDEDPNALYLFSLTSTTDIRASFCRSSLKKAVISNTEDPLKSVPASRREIWNKRMKAADRIVKYNFTSSSSSNNNKTSSSSSSLPTVVAKRNKNLWILAINETIDSILKLKIQNFFSSQAESLLTGSTTSNDDDEDYYYDFDASFALASLSSFQLAPPASKTLHQKQQQQPGKIKRTKTIKITKLVPKNSSLAAMSKNNNNNSKKVVASSSSISTTSNNHNNNKTAIHENAKNPLLYDLNRKSSHDDALDENDNSSSTAATMLKPDDSSGNIPIQRSHTTGFQEEEDVNPNTTDNNNAGTETTTTTIAAAAASSTEIPQEIVVNDGEANNNNNKDHHQSTPSGTTEHDKKQQEEEMVEIEVDEEVSDYDDDDDDEEEYLYRPIAAHPSIVIRKKITANNKQNNNNSNNGRKIVAASSSPTVSENLKKKKKKNTKKSSSSSKNNNKDKEVRRAEMAARQEFGFRKALISFLVEEHKRAMGHTNDTAGVADQNQEEDQDENHYPLYSAASFSHHQHQLRSNKMKQQQQQENPTVTASSTKDTTFKNSNKKFVGSSTCGLPSNLVGKGAKELFELHQTLSQPILSKEDEEKVKKSITALHEKHLKSVADRQEATDYRIDRDNLMTMVVFFCIVAIGIFFAMVLALIGIVRSTIEDKRRFQPVGGMPIPDVRYLYGFLERENTNPYEQVHFSMGRFELAGQHNWTAFVENCCCAAYDEQVDAVNVVSIEKWLCPGGNVKERIRKTNSVDSTTTIRPLCGKEFLNECRVDSGEVSPYYTFLEGCNSSVSNEEKKYW